MPKSYDSDNTAAGVLLRVRIATHLLESARKQAIATYNEDLRALRELDAKIATVQSANEPELFDAEKVLSPDLLSLINAPLAKYE